MSSSPYSNVGRHRVALVLVLAALFAAQPRAFAAFQELRVATVQHPFIVRVIAVEEDGVERHCSGALVSRWHVLTAAHCVDQARQSAVETSAGQRAAVARTILLDGWAQSDNPYAYDQALLRLAAPVADWRDLQLWQPVYLHDSFWSAGYPLGSAEVHAWSGSLDSLGLGVAYQEQPGQAGMSGSPLMRGDVVVGVHSFRLGDATGYSLIQQELVDRLAEDLHLLSSAPQGPYGLFLPLLVR